MQGAKEFYRISGEDQWLTVDRTDKTRSALYEDAGVPKTIVWSGPTVVVYTHGKLDAEHDDAPKSLSFLPLSLSSHLFRSKPIDERKSKVLCVLGIPAHISLSDFLTFISSSL